MYDPRRTYAKAAPEIMLFTSADEAKAALRAFCRRALRSWGFWLRALLLLAAPPIATVVLLKWGVPAIRQNVSPGIIGGVVGFIFGATLTIWWSYAVRRPLRRHLRRTLVAAGVPVCLECGYDLRGLDDARCPECGTPFDPALLDHKNRTRSVSDGPQ